MKPVSYQAMLSSANGGYPNLAPDCGLNTSDVTICEKGGFGSADSAVLKKPMVDNTGTRFYCFYCNNVSFSEAALNAHLKQHTAKYPFKCPHCGQGYMRRLCLVKHIDRLHSKSISQEPSKFDMTKSPHVPVSSALPSVPNAVPSSLRPTVRVTVPGLSVPTDRLDEDIQRRITLGTNLSNSTNGNAEIFSPLNGHIQHKRALTVSLPEEVTIPAGCLVELVEVKTVNGTKELKLRLVSKQENEPVMKDSSTTVSQNSAQGKPLSSTLNHPNTVTSVSRVMCTVDRKQCETKAEKLECLAVEPVAVSKNLPNQVNKERGGFKRTSQEIINLDCNTPIPSKVPKSILKPVLEGNSGIRVAHTESVNLTATPLAISSRVANRLTASLHPDNKGASVFQTDERKNLKSISIPPRAASVTKCIPQDVSVAVKVEPGELNVRTSAASEIMKDTVGLNQHTLKSASPLLSVPIAAGTQVKPPAIVVCKDNATAKPTFPVHKSLNGPSSVNAPVLSNLTNSKISTWTQEVRSSERAGEGDVPEPESFPVISSVFSLSQQPEEVQGSIQPLVMALRGIVMDKSSNCRRPDHTKITSSTAQVKGAPTSGYSAQLAAKTTSIIHSPLLTERTSESIKVEEHDKGVQHSSAHSHVDIKEERTCGTSTDSNKRSHTPASESSTDVGSVSRNVDTSVATDQQVAKSEHDISSKFLTVSLKRVQVGVWKRSKKGLKLRISRCKTQVPMGSVTDCTVIYPLPLKVDQLVKRPGPNQPVVVLNHPKPRIFAQGAKADSVADEGTSEVVPKCQILKMRLSKVMGQKYEVIGCTVRVFQ
ncbi:zinc finger protein 518B [Mastacembelus armatus]|uniref:Zinc finger protein 518B n=1 Tax=Mastacembelus armatus TaxID=205130 RepID=A0A7N8X288_9TELE|nr:zinc finger protein 518B [Mastacembelus armatus]